MCQTECLLLPFFLTMISGLYPKLKTWGCFIFSHAHHNKILVAGKWHHSTQTHDPLLKMRKKKKWVDKSTACVGGSAFHLDK